MRGEVDHTALGQFFEHDVLDVDLHGGAAVDLEGEDAFEGAFGFFEIGELHRRFAVDLVHEVVSLRDDGVLMPLGHIGLDEVVLAREPFHAGGVDDDALAVLRDDAASAFLIHHRAVGRVRVDVALVAADGPFFVGVLAAAVLDAGVVALLADFGLQFEVFDLPAAPDEKLIVGQLLRSGRVADDLAIFDLPKIRIAIPAGEVFAVEDRFKTVLRGSGRESKEREEDETFHGWSRA